MTKVSNNFNKMVQKDKTLEDFMTAASINDPEWLSEILSGGFDVNSQDEYGNTALITAAQGHNLEAIEFLISKKADVNIKNNDDNTPLIIAAWAGDAKIARVLLGAGASLEARDSDGKSAADWANQNKGCSVNTFAIQFKEIAEMIEAMPSLRKEQALKAAVILQHDI